MPEVRVTSDDADRLVRNIRAHADGKAFRRELSRGLNSVSKPVRAQMVDRIPAALPKRGGLAAQMQSMVASSTSIRSGRSAGVSIRFRSRGYDMRTLTGRRLRHPLYGDKRHWFTQTAGVNSEAFTGEFDQHKPEMQRAVGRVIDEIARKVQNI